MKKLLLVDDDSEWLELLRHHFIDSGFQVIVARGGLEALQLARKTAPDLVLLDLLLPDLDGMSICEILRKDPATAALPIILLTGMGGQIARLAAFDAGASDFVTKPIRPRDLVQRVDALLLSGSLASQRHTEVAKSSLVVQAGLRQTAPVLRGL